MLSRSAVQFVMLGDSFKTTSVSVPSRGIPIMRGESRKSTRSRFRFLPLKNRLPAIGGGYGCNECAMFRILDNPAMHSTLRESSCRRNQSRPLQASPEIA